MPTVHLPGMSEWLDLYRAAASGDREAQEKLLLPLQAPLRAYVRMRAGPLVRAAESVSDVVQSVFRELLKDLGRVSITEQSGLHGWALLAARRKLIDKVRYLRAEKRASPPAGELPSWSHVEEDVARVYSQLPGPSDLAVAAETQRLLEEALRALPELHQRVIVFVRLMGMSHADAARQLGRSPGATRILLMRALAGLAKELERSRG